SGGHAHARPRWCEVEPSNPTAIPALAHQEDPRYRRWFADMRVRVVLMATVAGLLGPFCQANADASGAPCDSRLVTKCLGKVTSNQERGQFHGLIMVNGQPDVLDAAAHAGTKPGCGDCEWTLILA